MGRNIERLGKVLDGRNKRTVAANTTKLNDKIELGTIDSNLALVPPTNTISPTNYDHCRPGIVF